MTTAKQDMEFLEKVVMPAFPGNFLEHTIEYIAKYFEPADVFPERELERWAEDNGYQKLTA
jgi:hypothetical protein